MAQAWSERRLTAASNWLPRSELGSREFGGRTGCGAYRVGVTTNRDPFVAVIGAQRGSSPPTQAVLTVLLQLDEARSELSVISAALGPRVKNSIAATLASVERELETMRGEGLVRRRGRRAATRWVVTAKGRRRARTA